ncbi:MAG: transglutaminase-like domain-containing protein [Eubacteriaceae bacterium]|nr:transglutaminase-like domain-containing protein [Eubacteriaceae bacterium]
MEKLSLKYSDLKYHALPLPEDVEREFQAGNLTKVKEKIAYYLSNEKVSEAVKKRLLIQLSNIEHIEDRYTVSPEDAAEYMAARGVKDFTDEELDELRMKGIVDWRYIDGEIRYIDSFAGSLVNVYPEFGNRSCDRQPEGPNPVDEVIEKAKDGEPMTAHIHIRHTLIVGEKSIREGEMLTAHMPIPKDGLNNQMKNIKILNTGHKPVSLAEGDSLQPTVCFREPAVSDMTFSVEYELDHAVVYRNLAKADLDQVSKGEIPEDARMYLEEKLPHIQFTPFLKALAEEIKGDETNPLLIARAIYDYITTKVDYRFAPNYAGIDNIPEYCAINGKGDCGIQALLFITLCRICGIPAAWQSGLDAKPNEVGEHDWARFYVPSIGWVFTDVSYGGSAYRKGATDRWNFFFGNVDPYRIPLNEDFQEEFYPPKKFMRFDPYDSQDGELEYDDEPVLFDFRRRYEDLGIYLK